MLGKPSARHGVLGRRSPALQRALRARAAHGCALDVALPPLCPSCREPLGDGIGLCAACWSKVSFIEPPYCARLGIPFTYDPGPGLLSMEAIADPPAYDRARAAVRYDDIARALVLTFKYGDRLDLAPMMGRWMARAGHELLAEADALIPVPLHWRQAVGAALQSVGGAGARDLEVCGVPVLDDALKRVRATPQQVGLSKTERADNVQGAFRVPAEQKAHVAGKRGGADRRRADLGRHGRYLRPRFAAGRRRSRRRAGIRAGCAPVRSPI